MKSGFKPAPRRRLRSAGFVALGLVASVAHAQQALTGDPKLACAAVLCLATGQRPNECNEAIQRYFSIHFTKPADTVKARRNFLALCPADNGDPAMGSWLDALANGAGRCDAASLNTETFVAGDPAYAAHAKNPNVEVEDGERPHIDDQLPAYCTALTSHPWAGGLTPYLPHYVGNPYSGGHWVDP